MKGSRENNPTTPSHLSAPVPVSPIEKGQVKRSLQESHMNSLALFSIILFRSSSRLSFVFKKPTPHPPLCGTGSPRRGSIKTNLSLRSRKAGEAISSLLSFYFYLLSYSTTVIHPNSSGISPFWIAISLL
jgi:hypothetical protein